MKPTAISLFVLFAAVSHADAVDDYIKGEMTRQHIPAVTVGIMRNGKLVDSRAYGLVDVELNVPCTVDNVFEIGSITKQFTSFATMLLIEEGKLSLSDPVSKYVANTPPSWSGITLRHMLNQMSGLPEYVLMPGLGLVDEFDQAKFIGDLSKVPLDFQPGSAWAYSNTNYALMGYVIEKVSGKPYTDFVTERVLKPLGMDHTLFLNPYLVLPNRAKGYMFDAGQLIRAKGMSGSINSDGTLASTVADMAKWDAALAEHKLLKPSSYDAIWSPGQLNSGRPRPYGMGWFLGTHGTPAYVGHGGNSSGYSAGFSRFMTAHLSVVMLSNLYPVGGEGMTRHIAELLDPTLVPATPTTKPDPDEKRTAAVKMGLSKLAVADPDSNYLESDVTIPMNTSRAKTFGPGGLAVFKDLKSLAFVGEESQGKDTWVTYIASVAGRDYVLNVLVSSASKIAQMTMRPVVAK